MVDLNTTYLGLPLKNPLVASASPLSKKVDTVRRLEEAGAAAVVVYSLFEEQIIHESLELDYYLSHGTDSSPEAQTLFPDLGTYNVGVEGYLHHLRNLKHAVSIPVIGSLNGVSRGGWLDYARKIEDAGADALELNLYSVPTDLGRSAKELEDGYLDLIHQVRSQVRFPLAVKLSPFFTSLPHFARQAVLAGADGLVLFNRFYQPDLDVETLEVVPDVTLSTSADLRLPLRWIAILYGRIRADLALTSGVHTAVDVVKGLMAGSSVVMMASELLANGVQRIGQLTEELATWMETYEYRSLMQMRGSMSQSAVAEPGVYERAQYMKALNSFDHRLP